MSQREINKLSYRIQRCHTMKTHHEKSYNKWDLRLSILKAELRKLRMGGKYH